MNRPSRHPLHAVGVCAVALLAALLFSACGGEDSTIPVFVTPTLPEPTTAAATPLPTVIPPTQEATEPPTGGAPAVSPDVTYGPIVGMLSTPAASTTGVPGTPTLAASATLPATPAPGVTFGPLVGPDHTLLPTETRLAPTPNPNATYGPIAGPNHTLMPTEVRTPVPAAPVTVIPPTSGPSPTPGPPLRRDLLGIQIHPHIDSSEFYDSLARAHDLGVTWIKYQFNWSLLESAPGQYTELFYMLRLYVQETHKQGFKVVIGVTKAPLWSRAADADGQKPEDGPPQDPQALASFLSGMLVAIGQDANGQPYIDAIEVWNEPNLEREWQGHPMTGAEYMRYFRLAYSAIRAFSPHITVVTAAPAPTGTSGESTDDRAWLRQLYGAGLAQYGANVAVGVHPYGWANAPDARCCGGVTAGWNESPQFFFLDTLEDYRNIMVTYGHSGAQLWVTEFGWATFDGLRADTGGSPALPAGSEFIGYLNQQQQADYTLRAFTLGQDLSYVGPMILWNLNFATLDGAVNHSDQQAGYGLLDNHFQPRPVYNALQQAPKQ